MKIVLDTTSEKYLTGIRERFDSWLMLGQERYIGWTIGKFFSVSYYSGKEFGQRNYLINNKAIGLVTSKDDKAVVYYYNFQGLTDPISLVTLFLISLFIGIYADISDSILFAFVWVTAVAVTTWICTRVSSVGEAGRARLDKFLRYNN